MALARTTRRRSCAELVEAAWSAESPGSARGGSPAPTWSMPDSVTAGSIGLTAERSLETPHSTLIARQHVCNRVVPARLSPALPACRRVKVAIACRGEPPGQRRRCEREVGDGTGKRRWTEAHWRGNGSRPEIRDEVSICDERRRGR